MDLVTNAWTVSHNSHFACCRYAAAESDCSLAIALDDSYVKAYLRRGTARTKLGKLKEAKEGQSVSHGGMEDVTCVIFLFQILTLY